MSQSTLPWPLQQRFLVTKIASHTSGMRDPIQCRVSSCDRTAGTLEYHREGLRGSGIWGSWSITVAIAGDRRTEVYRGVQSKYVVKRRRFKGGLGVGGQSPFRLVQIRVR